MNNLKFNNNNNFSNENISSSTSNNNLVLLQEQNKRASQENESFKPQLNNNFSNNNTQKISPKLNNNKSSNNFHLFANPKKTNDETTSEEEDDDNDEIDLSDQNNNFQNMEEDDDDEIDLSDNNRQDFSNSQFNQNSFDNYEDDDEEEELVSSDESVSQPNTQNNKEDDDNNFDEFPDVPPENYKERGRIKQELLLRLLRLDKAGYTASKRYNMASCYDDLLFEYRRLKKQRDIEKSIKMSRYILTSIISGIEFLNNKFDPLGLKLDRWSENVMENINDYDEVFEELHDKYSGSVSMAPELKLLMMVAGSGFMFHLTNSLFKSATPDLNDILRQNPDIMKNISQAAMKNMSNKMGGENDPISKMMMGGLNMVNNNRASQNSQGPQRPGGPSMGGPTGVDDILNELEKGDKPKPAFAQSRNIASGPRMTKTPQGLNLNL